MSAHSGTPRVGDPTPAAGPAPGAAPRGARRKVRGKPPVLSLLPIATLLAGVLPNEERCGSVCPPARAFFRGRSPASCRCAARPPARAPEAGSARFADRGHLPDAPAKRPAPPLQALPRRVAVAARRGCRGPPRAPAHRVPRVSSRRSGRDGGELRTGGAHARRAGRRSAAPGPAGNRPPFPLSRGDPRCGVGEGGDSRARGGERAKRPSGNARRLRRSIGGALSAIEPAPGPRKTAAPVRARCVRDGAFPDPTRRRRRLCAPRPVLAGRCGRSPLLFIGLDPDSHHWGSTSVGRGARPAPKTAPPGRRLPIGPGRPARTGARVRRPAGGAGRFARRRCAPDGARRPASRGKPGVLRRSRGERAIRGRSCVAADDFGAKTRHRGCT